MVAFVCIRSSRPEVVCIKVVLRNFTKFTGKDPWQSLFFNKVAGLRPATLLKKRLWNKCFPVIFAKSLRTSFLTEHLWWLLLLYVAIHPSFISVLFVHLTYFWTKETIETIQKKTILTVFIAKIFHGKVSYIYQMYYKKVA